MGSVVVRGNAKAIVIGAGGAGLAAARAMKQAGFSVVILEQNDALGGVWWTTKYPSLTIHSKSFNYRFHDFPAIASKGPSATREEVLAYFNDYANAHALEIRYQTRVSQIAVDGDRCRINDEDCDVVICASGFSNAGHPHKPTIEGTGVKVLHSSEVTAADIEDMRTKKVVVLGAGKSAHEILSLLHNVDTTWVYAKSLWALSYEKLYGSKLNALLYLYYMKTGALRRRLGFGRTMKVVQAPLRWSGFLLNPLEPRSDVWQSRVAIMKEEQRAFLEKVRSIKANVVRIEPRAVVLENNHRVEADYLICATGYDRSKNVPTILKDGKPYSLVAQPGFHHHMVDPNVPKVSVFSADVLYPQQLLGYSLGAQWLARFHAGTLVRGPKLETKATHLDPWCSTNYLSNGFPYVHQRQDVLPNLFEEMGLSKRLALSLVLNGANEAKLDRLCDEITRQLNAPPGGGGMKPAATKRSK